MSEFSAKHFKELEDKLNIILTTLSKISKNPELLDVQIFINHGEYGCALDLLVYIIYEHKKVISLEMLNSLKELASTMEMKDVQEILDELFTEN